MEQEREVAQVLERGRQIIRAILRRVQDENGSWYVENGDGLAGGREAITPYLAALVNLGYVDAHDDGMHLRLTEAGRQRLSALEATGGMLPQ
ncbi:MAG: hypothetical protein NW703_12720 [Nitrospiraceae bacterium]